MTEARGGPPRDGVVLARTLLWRGVEYPYVEVWLEDVQLGDRRWAQHRVLVGGGVPGCVVVPVRDDEILLALSWRPAVRVWAWELPRGFGRSVGEGADDEAPEETGARELLEETGYRVATSRLLGWIWPDSGLLGNTVAVVRAQVAAGSRRPVTDREVSQTKWVPVAQLPELIADGTLRDGLTLAALAKSGYSVGSS
jgi:ADP-ribose pyrophosphatase